MMEIKKYPHSQVTMLPGDILYSPIGKSTYFVGHIVIIGADLHVKESLPTNPSGHSATIEQFWQRHRMGDTITLFRSIIGSKLAAKWAQTYVKDVKKYYLGNHDINNITQNYCSKFVMQAYYFGANIELGNRLDRLITPQALIRSPLLRKLVIFKR